MNANITKEMADAREQQQRVLTIEGAIAKALFMRKNPEYMLDGAGARELALTLLAALEFSPCYFKAIQKGEEVFVLRQQDRAAPAAIAFWATEASDHGCPDAKVDNAYRTATRWRQQPEVQTKWPD